MNCPHCRRALGYERELSSPQGKPKRLTYYCGPCQTLYIFEEFDVKSTRRGVFVMKQTRLRRAGYYREDPVIRGT